MESPNWANQHLIRSFTAAHDKRASNNGDRIRDALFRKFKLQQRLRSQQLVLNGNCLTAFTHYYAYHHRQDDHLLAYVFVDKRKINRTPTFAQ